MPSPAYLLRDLYTEDELKAMLKELFATGMITAMSGGQKSGSFARLSPERQAIELRAEIDRLNGEAIPKKIYMDLTGYK
jgi:hypothetical protein